MAAVTQPVLRKLLSLGTGVGIRVAGPNLEIAAVRVRPQAVTLLGTLTIEDFRDRPAAEAGSEYARFTQSAGLQNAGALVLLPRHELVVRTLQLPGVTDQDARAPSGFSWKDCILTRKRKSNMTGNASDEPLPFLWRWLGVKSSTSTRLGSPKQVSRWLASLMPRVRSTMR